MKKSIQVLLFLLFLSQMASAQKQAYLIYNKQGEASSYEQLLQQAQEADIILFGEQHNNPIDHWLQLSLAEDLLKIKGKKLLLGAEMFEADGQLVLSEYLKGAIKETHFKTDGKLWPNYATDYAPLVELAKANGLTFVATNIPRRYANLVARQGLQALDSLAPEAKAFIAPLPIAVDLALPNYQKMADMMHGGANAQLFVFAQASKDATMAHFIAKNWKAGQTLLHFHGTFHANNFEGIYWYLKKLNPALKIMTIGSVAQTATSPLDQEYQQLADFIICTPENMTKTH